MGRSRVAVCSVLLVAAVASAARGETVSVAVAISLKDAMEGIAAAYKAESGDEVTFTLGSSGQLMAQIGNGAPIDAFISAANKQVDALIEKGKLDKATRRVVAGNRLVLIVPAGAKSAPASFNDLADPKHRRLAVGEPKTVPAGQYAKQVLEKLGVADALAGRLVYGANVRQVLDYVTRGEVAAGIVYATDAKAAGNDKVRVVATADPATHDPIVYPAAVVTKSDKRQAAARFLEFLAGEKARTILKDRGFLVPEKPKQRAADVANDPPHDAGTEEPAQREPASR